MEAVTHKVAEFLESASEGNGSSYRCGNGRGRGSGYGYDDGSGDGCGDGSGYGYDDGSGYGCGDGSGDGCGDGSGDGYGYGSGYGSGHGYGNGCHKGWREGTGPLIINGERVWIVDGWPTIIREVRGIVAKGSTLESDWSQHPCYIVKGKGKKKWMFAHGETLHEAHKYLQLKIFSTYTEEERVAEFRKAYPNPDVKIPAAELFEWHGRLTGSCLMGRKSFIRSHGIDLERDSFTIREFVSLTKDAYGGDIVRKLLKN